MNKDGWSWKEHYGFDGIAVFLQHLNRDGWNWEEHYELDGEGHSYGEDVIYVNGSLTGTMVGNAGITNLELWKLLDGLENGTNTIWNGTDMDGSKHASGLEVNWLRRSYDKGCHTSTHMHAYTKGYTRTQVCTQADTYRYTGTFSWIARNFNLTITVLLNFDWTIAVLLNFNRTILIDVEF